MKSFTAKWMIIIFPLFLLLNTASAQSVNTDFIDMMREGGKIYVVYLLLGVILLGILIYLVLLERKLAKLEKKN